ncbi:hypothetical protein ACFWXH_22510 [Mesorhizobium sp. NPDC059054]|uniref:hypothetical protein n=1 Tax=Mesorhizobium sp. NPDC059054 TaxID=3346711 RepID=UPI0036CA5726
MLNDDRIQVVAIGTTDSPAHGIDNMPRQMLEDKARFEASRRTLEAQLHLFRTGQRGGCDRTHQGCKGTERPEHRSAGDILPEPAA